MAVYDTSKMKDPSYLFSQTPPNFVEPNYYLKSLQMKVDADWPYRPNRKWIEEEKEAGTELYEPLEVVIQSVKNDKGEAVSDDWYRLVFKDCRRQNKVGYRYRFSYEFDPTEPNYRKNIWIGLNQTTMSPTSSQVVCRCNGNIGSIYTDENGQTSYHYEPVIQPSKLSNPMFDYSEVAIDPDGSMTLIAQYNKYTKQYYINQRFIIGTDRVYKVNNIIKSDSRTTFDMEDVGIMRIYLAMDQTGKLDNFETRIAYNGHEDDPNPETGDDGEYTFTISEPGAIPDTIPSDGLTFEPRVYKNGLPTEAEITCATTLEGYGSDMMSVEDYCELIDNKDGTFTLKRKMIDNQLQVVVRCVAIVEGQPEMMLEFKVSLRPF